MNSKICALVTSGIVSLFIGATIPAYATTYYVPSQYSTVQAAYDVCQPGDTVIVADGTYTKSGQTDLLRMTGFGTPSAPITVEAANIGGAILDGQNISGTDGYSNSTVYIDGSYNVLKGFKIKGGYDGGVSIWGWNGGGAGNQVLQNEIYDNGNLNNGGSGNSGIFDDSDTAQNSYVGNYIHDNGRISLGVNTDHGMYLCATQGDEVINNIIYHNCSYGIQVAGYNNIANMAIYNNTIVSNLNRGGIILWSHGGSVSGIAIVNNIIYGNGNANGTDSQGVEAYMCYGSDVGISNNLFYGNTGGAWDMTNGSTVTYTLSGNITNSDPEFFDPASNWHLQKCSPAIDAGLTLSTVTDDYDGLPRPIPVGGDYDIGAYER